MAPACAIGYVMCTENRQGDYQARLKSILKPYQDPISKRLVPALRSDRVTKAQKVALDRRHCGFSRRRCGAAVIDVPASGLEESPESTMVRILLSTDHSQTTCPQINAPFAKARRLSRKDLRQSIARYAITDRVTGKRRAELSFHDQALTWS